MSDSVYGTGGIGCPVSAAAITAAEVDLHAVELGRQPAVAVVEADDVAAAIGEQPAEVVVPRDQLGGEAHDEQQGRVVGRAEGLVLELDPPGECGSGHG